jgi:hypothetical protein
MIINKNSNFLNNMKKRKLSENYFTLPEDTLIEIFSFLPPKDQLVSVSSFSKKFQKFYSKKNVLEDLLKKNDLFVPYFNIEMLPHLFYREIFFPMQQTKFYVEKIRNLLPEKFENKTMLKNLENYMESIKNNQIPPAIQMFYTLFSSFGSEPDNFCLWGSELCNHKIVKINSEIMKGKFIDLGREDFLSSNSMVILASLDESNFGQIAVTDQDTIENETNFYVSDVKFHEFIKAFHDYIEKFKQFYDVSPLRNTDPFHECFINQRFQESYWRIFIFYYLKKRNQKLVHPCDKLK